MDPHKTLEIVIQVVVQIVVKGAAGPLAADPGATLRVTAPDSSRAADRSGARLHLQRAGHGHRPGGGPGSRPDPGWAPPAYAQEPLTPSWAAGTAQDPDRRPAAVIVAVALGILLHLQRIHLVVAALTLFYFAAAIVPWTALFLPN